MWRNIYILICLTVFSVVHSLECGIAEQASDQFVKDAFSRCFIKIEEPTTIPPTSPSPSPSTNSTLSPTSNASLSPTPATNSSLGPSLDPNTNSSVGPSTNSSLGPRPSDISPAISNETISVPNGNDATHENLTNQAYTSDGRKIKRDTVATNASTVDTKPQIVPSVPSTEAPAISQIDKKCIIYCLFTNLGLSDDKGMPQRELVSKFLLKNAENRELRDFIQDAIDGCFQESDQTDKTDLCEYTNKLASCLGVRGRTNCADWNIFDMPFSK